ncbi:class I SAM-dependent methyltransferase [Frondihabitans cladoniiphilus]
MTPTTPAHPAQPAAHGHHHERPGHGDRPGHGPAPENDTDLAELLDLDAQHAAPVLAAALDAAAAALGHAPREVVDLGAGTGTGTLALAARFSGARVHALDASAGMIERIRASAALSGLSERIETHLVDLDTDWPAAVPHEVDMAWAALSLHHTSDPSRVLRQVFDVLRPGGVVVATEFSGATTYSPADLGTGSSDLGGRVVSALATRGYPVTAEWTEALVAAGFSDVSRHEATVAVSSRTAAGARFLELQLQRNRELLGDELGADDLAGLDAAIAGLGAGASSVDHTSGRVFWVAVRP